MPNCKVIATPPFEKELRRLAKKYLSLTEDLSELSNKLKINPELGTSLGGNIYKIRMAIKSKGKGKSGGARIITYYLTKDNELFLLSIYDKSEQGDLPIQKIKALIASVLADLK